MVARGIVFETPSVTSMRAPEVGYRHEYIDGNRIKRVKVYKAAWRLC